jgi:EmrB/QacA subfamily drug resistance transporter
MTASTAPRTPHGPAHPSAILTIILMSYFMIVLGNSIVFTGLPSIQADLGYSDAELSWVQNAYTLVFGGLLLLGARAGDILGRRTVLIAGLTVFSAASLLIGVAPTGWLLIAARALQGVGAAVLAPSSLSLLTASFDGEQRTRAVAWYGAVAGIGASVGLVIGGALAQLVSWRAGFFLNVPIGIALLVLAARYLPRDRRNRGRFDLAGALTSTLGVGALVFGIVQSTDAGWASPATIVPLVAAIVLLGLLILNERRAQEPLSLFASAVRSGSYVARLLFAGAIIAFFYFCTQFFQGVYGYTPLQAGLAFLPMTVVQLIAAAFVTRLTARIGNAALLAIGLAVTAAGMLWVSFARADTPYLLGIALPMLLIGIGQGLGFGPLTSASLTGATSANAGAASGMVNAVHQIGSTLGVAVLVTVSSGVPGGLAPRLAGAFTGSTVMLAVALLAALLLIVPSGAAARKAARTAVTATDE